MANHSANINAQQLSRELEELDRLVHRIRAHIIPTPSDKRSLAQSEVRTIIDNTAGVLKDKIDEDIVGWQRKIRAEWD